MSNFQPFSKIDLAQSKSSINISEFLNLVDYEKGIKGRFFRNSPYQVVWYRNLYNLGEGKTNKRVEVVFVSSTGFEISAKLPLEIIIKVPIGSIWKNGLIVQELDADQYVFTLQEVLGKDSIRPNVEYISAFSEKQKEKKRDDYKAKIVLSKHTYPVGGIDTETNTLIVVEQDKVKFIIHPLTFFLAHYGCSKQINNVLVSYPWGDIDNQHSDTVKNILELDYRNPLCPKAVLIPRKCLISDAAFLHHLREDDYTKKIVKTFNSTIRHKLINNQTKSGGISVKPYHKQRIEVLVKGIPLDNGIILCSEIIGMSMPRGEEIFYDFETNIQNSGNGTTQSFRPMYVNIDEETIVVADIRGPNNSTTAVIRQRQKVLGNIRVISRNEGISIADAFKYKTKSIPLDEPIPDSYAPGELANVAGDVGMLKVFVDSGVEEYTDTYTHKILRYARQLKHDYNSGAVKIDCYTIKKGYIGEALDTLKTTADKFPKYIYVLRLIINGQYYFIFDSQPLSILDKSGITGIIMKVDSSFNPNSSIKELFNNEGKFHNMKQDHIKTFNHMTKSKTSNWLRTALTKFDKK